MSQLNNLALILRAMMDYLEKRMQFYKLTMETSINDHKTYFSHDDLVKLHQKLKNDILAEIQEQADNGNFCRNVCVRQPTHFDMKKTDIFCNRFQKSRAANWYQPIDVTQGKKSNRCFQR